jgi:tRNA A-37 threonylcarbamoyl transferase component Bud32
VIQVGQVLDKYELLERVGQGGMSIVYRATDRSLRRTVAVKILHRHLADSAEARDRFEREAHAVAKLRHENIVEIFAYSGKGSDDSYIVTEFIDGSTLKEFLSDHPIAFPEVAAMIVLQIGRALAHAHAAGILHRDIKPENVMIRSDGVVKLMDFGISQMVDLQRLTVTGQLLGSPAYMSPEHVEGQPLDFRTDVFACGIVLYQLATGRLPFEGKNPHEILKRIADCKFPDPRQSNPRVGNELGKIILKAMARQPNDRYRDVAELVAALDAYVTGSGLGPVAQELSRYFQSPASYELALKERLVDHLVRKGKDTMPVSRPAALEAYDRVLTIDPTNATVLAVLARLGDRQRWKRGAFIALALLIIAGGAYGARRMMRAPASATPQVAGLGSSDLLEPVRKTQPDELRVPLPGVGPDAATTAGNGASGSSGAGDSRRGSDTNGGGSVRPGRTPDAAPAPSTLAPVTIIVSPRNSTVRANGQLRPVDADGRVLIGLTAEAPVEITVSNELCQSETITLDATLAGKEKTVGLMYLPATITPTCATPGVTVRIDNKDALLGSTQQIPFGDTLTTTRRVKVEFIGEKIDVQDRDVHPRDSIEVKCAL